MKTTKLLIPCLIILLTSCQKEKTSNPGNQSLTIYALNEERLLADYAAPTGDNIYFFGNSNASGEAENISTISVQLFNSDTLIHFQYNETNQIRFIYFSNTNGVKYPSVLNFEYIPIDSVILFSYFEKNWVTDDETLMFQTSVKNQGGGLTSLPVFFRGEEEAFKNLAWDVIMSNIAEVSSTYEAVIGLAIGTIVSYKNPTLGALILLGSIIPVIANENAKLSAQLPNSVLLGIHNVENALNNVNFIEQCVQNPISFTFFMDINGKLTFTSVSGGTPPYTFAINNLDFKEDIVFDKGFNLGELLLLMVRDKNGCIASIAQKVPAIFTDPRDGQEYTAVKIGNKIWTTKNLNFDAPGSLCYDNSPVNCNTYGRLYPWNVAITACPPEWHLPSFEEWLDIIQPAIHEANIYGDKILYTASAIRLQSHFVFNFKSGGGFKVINNIGFHDLETWGWYWTSTPHDSLSISGQNYSFLGYKQQDESVFIWDPHSRFAPGDQIASTANSCRCVKN